MCQESFSRLGLVTADAPMHTGSPGHPACSPAVGTRPESKSGRGILDVVLTLHIKPMDPGPQRALLSKPRPMLRITESWEHRLWGHMDLDSSPHLSTPSGTTLEETLRLGQTRCPRL